MSFSLLGFCGRWIVVKVIYLLNIAVFKQYLHVYSKDVRLPVHLQRAMAAEAEAAREARAKVKSTTFVKLLQLPMF